MPNAPDKLPREEQTTTSLGGRKVPIAERFFFSELQGSTTRRTRDIMLGTTDVHSSNGNGIADAEQASLDALMDRIAAEGMEFCECLEILLRQNTTESEMLRFLDAAGIRAPELKMLTEQITTSQERVVVQLRAWIQEKEERGAATDLVA